MWRKAVSFLSALLISSVLFREDFIIHVQGQHGMAYVEMTVAMMEQFGVTVHRPSPDTFCIPGECRLQSQSVSDRAGCVRGVYFLCRCARFLRSRRRWQMCIGTACRGILHFFMCWKRWDAAAWRNRRGFRLLPPETSLKGGCFDLSAFSDQALTLAAISCFAEEPVTITGISHIRYQECDRIYAIVSNLKRMGIRCEETTEGSLTIYPGTPHGCEVETFEDHRVAMSFALPGLVTGGIVIKNPGCCRKTFENYFDVLESCVLNESR